MKSRLFVLALSGVLLLACAGPAEEASAPTEAEDAEAIRAMFADWVRVSEEGDAEAYGAHLTDDFIFLAPGAPPVAGKAEVVPWVSGFFEDFDFALPEWTTDEIIVRGDVAIHRYSGVATLTPKAGGEARILDRKYMDVLRRGEDGVWRASHHMFNLNN